MTGYAFVCSSHTCINSSADVQTNTQKISALETGTAVLKTKKIGSDQLGDNIVQKKHISNDLRKELHLNDTLIENYIVAEADYDGTTELCSAGHLLGESNYLTNNRLSVSNHCVV